MDDERGLLEVIVGDGRPLLIFTGLCLALSGGFALFLSATGEFLPHDIAFLGMTARDLCALHQCRIAHFMFHDRVSFGGALIAIGALYMWLAEFPLKRGEAWAWWLFALSGALGFSTFLAYLGYGYLDTWHGVATLFLLPCFAVGLVSAWRALPERQGIASLRRAANWNSREKTAVIGRACLLLTGVGMIFGGLTIMTVGMTSVFVPQDLAYIGTSAAQLNAINPRLMPLIAHDRAGFGGGIASCGVLVLGCAWCARPSRSLWQILLIAGATGFGCAIGVHPVVGYNNPTHLAPAIAGALVFCAGLVLTYKIMMERK